MSAGNSQRILAVTNNFPTPRFPERGAFVLNVLREMARQQAQVDVIAPVSWVSELKRVGRAPVPTAFAPLQVRQPAITTLPLWAGPGRIVTAFNEDRTAAGVARSLRGRGPWDFAYAHFLPSGRAALQALRRQRNPVRVFLNLGESDPWDYDGYYDKEGWVRELEAFAGIVTVSERNRAYLLERNPRLERLTRCIPNGVDTERFRPLDRSECRQRLGLRQDAKLVVFSGHLDARKGPLRVLQAVRQLGIQGLFLGSNGPDRPSGEGVAYAGSVANDDMPSWLNAADCFVLPSLSEGMSNAVLEALACGLPLVVSDRPFNTAFLDACCAVLVDPEDPGAIAAGIARCLEPATAAALSAAARTRAMRFGIAARVERILQFVAEAAA